MLIGEPMMNVMQEMTKHLMLIILQYSWGQWEVAGWCYVGTKLGPRSVRLGSGPFLCPLF